MWGGVEDREASNLAAVERRSSPEAEQLLEGGSKPRQKGLLAQPSARPAWLGLCMAAGRGRTLRLATQSEEGREGAGGAGPSSTHHTDRAPSRVELESARVSWGTGNTWSRKASLLF